MSDLIALDRRQFVLNAALLAGGLLVGCRTTGGSKSLSQTPGDEAPVFTPSAWVHILASGQVCLILDRVEMGQGTMTAHASIIAEELGIAPKDVHVRFAPVDKAYVNPILGSQVTGGSTSTAGSFKPLRLAGAATREMLTAGGAQKLGVNAAECSCEGGKILHKPSGKSIGFGEIAAFTAENIKVPSAPEVKDFASFKVLGKSVKRLDSPAKVRGEATYGIDFKIPGMLVGVIVRAPAQGARMISFDDSKAKAYFAAQGVEGLILPTSRGVAVLSSNFWLSKSAAALLSTKSSAGSAAGFDGDFGKVARDLGADRDNGPMLDVQRAGDGAASLDAASNSARVIESRYEVPFLPHQTMEPMNCTASFANGRLEVWAPCQTADSARAVAARAAGLKEEQVTIYTTLIGGGFGRRLAVDYVHEAAEVARAVGKPVKIIWTREDDTRHDYYRPGMYHVMRASLGGPGIASWSQRIVGQSVLVGFLKEIPLGNPPERGTTAPPAETPKAFTASTSVPSPDSFVIEGADTFPYQIPNRLIRWRQVETGVQVGFWRSVGHSHNAFAIEGFMNELAAAAKLDAVQFRRQLLSGKLRELAVLNKVATMSGWGNPVAQPSQGKRALGVALHCCFGSYCAQVVQIKLLDNTVTVEKVWCAIDVGFVVNPDIIVAQTEGSIIYGLSAALKQNITMKNGVVQQSNFNNCPILRLAETPEIIVSIVDGTNSLNNPSGAGETAVPALAPALAHAIYQANGQIYRKTPFPLATGRVRAAAAGGASAGVDPELRSAAQAAIEANCGSCHSAPAAEGGIGNIENLDALADNKRARRRYKSIIGKSMPPPYEENGQLISPISEQDKNAIFSWLDAVAKSRGE